MDLPKTMQAAVLYGPNDLRVQMCPVPTPDAHEVLIKVRACAICGSDPKALGPHWTYNKLDYGRHILGHEYSGEIVALGSGVTEFSVGDRIAVEAHKGCGICINCIRGRYTICLNYGRLETGHRHYGFTANGGYADYVVNHTNTVHKIPEQISYAEATLVTTGGSVMSAIENAGGFLGGESVAIFGAGPIGLLASGITRALGATRVYLFDHLVKRLAVGRRMGADGAFDISVVDPIARVRELTDGIGADIALECSGNPAAQASCVEVVRRGGRIAFIGDPPDYATLNMKRFVMDSLSASGVRGEGGASCRRVIALLQAGVIDAKPLITHHFPLAQINEAFDLFINRREGALKVVVEPNSD